MDLWLLMVLRYSVAYDLKLHYSLVIFFLLLSLLSSVG